MHKHSKQVEDTTDIRQVVLSCLASVLEVTFIIRSDSIRSDYIPEYKKLMENARSHCLELKLLKNRFAGKLWTSNLKAIKPHAGMHFIPQSV